MHARYIFLCISVFCSQIILSKSNLADTTPQYLYMRLMRDRLQMAGLPSDEKGIIASTPEFTSVTGQLPTSLYDFF